MLRGSLHGRHFVFQPLDIPPSLGHPALGCRVRAGQLRRAGLGVLHGARRYRGGGLPAGQGSGRIFDRKAL